jgi:hypothetical protein
MMTSKTSSMGTGHTGHTGAAAATAGAAAAGEKKEGFFQHLFHHGGTGTGTTAAATHPTAASHATAASHLPTTMSSTNEAYEQGDRFIDQLNRNKDELSYYEQFVVQYNRGMRFTPEQAKRLVEVLIRNSAGGKGRAVPYYSPYALELLLKLAVADPIIHNEMERLGDQELRMIRMDKYIGEDETKPLGLNFVLYLYKYLNKRRYQDYVITNKPEKDQLIHKQLSDYLATQQAYSMEPFVEGISRRLPPLLPHQPIGAHILSMSEMPMTGETYLMSKQPLTAPAGTTYVSTQSTFSQTVPTAFPGTTSAIPPPGTK